MLYATYFFFGAGIGVAHMDRGLLAADGRMAKVSWDWMVADDRSVLPAVGADLHQARNTGQSGAAAGLV